MTTEPFRRVHKTEMTIATEDPPIVAAEVGTPRFRWTTTDDTILEADAGKRWMGVAPMASDGNYIYTLVMYREDDAASLTKATYCEKYELVENVITFVKEVKLLDNEDKPWIGK